MTEKTKIHPRNPEITRPRIEWFQRGMGTGLKSDCRRFALFSYTLGLYSLRDYECEEVSTFRSMEAAMREAERRNEE